ncbi:hypothetical protein [Microcoleus asticus]|uniref:Uncharacterized protein n=1 Tax=Microcoleus asticus IPMA8 TaxID=2563858 RepID=A0ABX2D291_9CYAN|nr:hypothetical protein [Microcoleus asticus]NQE36749.1 hypothetical protein [Microcoleus asticus IPMA8]
MTNLTNSEIVHKHIHSHPEAFLEALESASPETRKAVRAHLQTLPEVEVDNQQESVTPSEEIEKI